jgi:hypothetical protein
MSGVFLLNPDRYMTRELCAISGVQFAWTREHLALEKLNPDEWKASLGAASIRHLEYNVREANKLVNPEFSDSLWGNDMYGVYLFDPLTLSPEGQVRLPTGILATQKMQTLKPWLRKLGIDWFTKRTDFRVYFNIRSLVYASRILNLDIVTVDTYDNGGSIHNSYVREDFKGDRSDYKVTCDTCIVNYKCDYARKGAVCILPNSEAGVFAKMIGSRDTKTILEGLRLMVTRNGERLEEAIEAEVRGEPTKEVTGLMNSVFNQAIQLAKLQDPSLRASPKIQIGISAGGAVTVDGTTSGQPGSNEIATALKELQDHGMNLKDITEDILIKYMSAKDTGDVRQIAAVVNQYTAIDAAPNSY